MYKQTVENSILMFADSSERGRYVGSVAPTAGGEVGNVRLLNS